MIYKFIDRIFIVLGALLFAQAPLFMQAYRHQLSGHIAELRWNIESMRHAAMLSGKTLEAFVLKFVQSGDQDFARQGAIMQEMIDRFQQFSAGLSAIDNATLFSRPFAFMWHLNYDVAIATLHGYAIGIPLTFEGIGYGMIGILVSYGFYTLICKGLRRLIPKRIVKANI